MPAKVASCGEILAGSSAAGLVGTRGTISMKVTSCSFSVSHLMYFSDSSTFGPLALTTPFLPVPPYARGAIVPFGIFGSGNAEYAVNSGAVVTWTGTDTTLPQKTATSWTLKNDFSRSGLVWL